MVKILQNGLICVIGSLLLIVIFKNFSHKNHRHYDNTHSFVITTDLKLLYNPDSSLIITTAK